MTPYPDLDSTPNTANEINQRVRVAQAFGECVDRKYGSLHRRDWETGGLSDLFYDPSLEWRRELQRRLDSADLHATVDVGYSEGFRPRGPHSESMHSIRQPWLSEPSDVLGVIPEPYQDSGCSMFQDYIALEWIYSMDRGMTRHRIEFLPENWGEIAEVLRTLYRVVRSKAFGLVALVRSRLDTIEHAAMPRLRLHEVLRKRNREAWIVTLAGAERTVTLSWLEAEFLRSIADTGTAKAFRNAKLTLLKKVPELVAWIRPAGSRSRIDDNKSVYSAPRELVERSGPVSRKKK